MKRNFFFNVIGGFVGFFLALLLINVTHSASALDLNRSSVVQSPASNVSAPSAVPISTTFTYQGQLKNSGVPVTGSCGMVFRLYDDPSAGNLIGSPITLTAPITNGLFTVGLNFGSTAFTGNARWLDIRVQCPAGSGGYTTLSPRQALTAAPYALHAADAWSVNGNAGMDAGQNFLGTTDNMTFTIRVSNTAAYRIVPAVDPYNGFAPNIIGGSNANTVASGLRGATVAGGGSGYPNVITGRGNYATIGGGNNNNASGGGATISGGAGNTINDWGGAATIGGGAGNNASYVGATIGGGESNTASGSDATIGGGESNTASGNYATISGGVSNIASGVSSFIGGGGYDVYGAIGNIAQGNASTIGGGNGNVISLTGTSAFIGGGNSNTASNPYATIPGGKEAQASDYGQFAFASGGFNSTGGTAQYSVHVLRNVTPTDGNWVELSADGAGQRITVPPNKAMSFYAQVVGMTNDGWMGAWEFRGAIRNTGGAATQGCATATCTPTIPLKIVLQSLPSGEDAQIQADSVNNALVIYVKGNTSHPMRWVATVQLTEVQW